MHVLSAAAIPAIGLLIVSLGGLPQTGCGSSGPASLDVIPSDVPQTAFSISDERELIGGPLAQGGLGDYRMANGKIRAIIQKPIREVGFASFGGVPIDIDLIRSGTKGEDHLGALIPLINLEWSVNYRDFAAAGDVSRGETQVLTATGILDTYDYIDTDFIAPIAETLLGQSLTFPARFDDRSEPFRFTSLQGLDPTIRTDYILRPDATFLEIRTTFKNRGPDPVTLPVGDLITVSHRLNTLVPGKETVKGNYIKPCQALIYENRALAVSYGLFYPEATEETSCVRTEGASAILPGDDIQKLLGETPSRFVLAPGEEKTLVRYLFAGDGTVASVMEPAAELLGREMVEGWGSVTAPSDEAPGGAQGMALIEGVTNAGTGELLAARLTLVHETKGIVAIRTVNDRGTLETTPSRRIPLEPGRYHFVFSHGPRFTIETKTLNIASGSTTKARASLREVMPPGGFVAADLHLHSTRSVDGAVTPEERVIQARAEDLDILLSTDHDILTDYTESMAALRAQGILTNNQPASIIGDEITSMALGHFQAFPLSRQPQSPTGGAIDWTLTDRDVVGPDPDFILSPAELFQKIRATPGEKVIQINHIIDPLSSYFGLIQAVTSPHFRGIEPFSTLSNPIDYRLGASTDADQAPPYPPGTSALFSPNFTAVELVTGVGLSTLDDLRLKALPVWFNLLNLGLIVTATASSDSHDLLHPIGLPRNIVAGSTLADEFAQNINRHRVVMSAGPFIDIEASNSAGVTVGVGATLKGDPITLNVTAMSPAWAPFDRVEIFVNADPKPAADTIAKPSQEIPFSGGAKAFFKTGHAGKYFYRPFLAQDIQPKDDGTGRLVWRSEPISIGLSRDGWVVVLVYGSEEVPSIYPIATELGCLPAAIPAESGTSAPTDACLPDNPFAPTTGPRAWAVTNPIFIDADADGVFTPLYKQ